jgi:hypothetical protein
MLGFQTVGHSLFKRGDLALPALLMVQVQGQLLRGRYKKVAMYLKL